jgi:hypothetical protein
MRWLLLVGLAACQSCKSHDPSPSPNVGSAVTPAPVAPKPALHVHCEPARLPPRPSLKPPSQQPSGAATQAAPRAPRAGVVDKDNPLAPDPNSPSSHHPSQERELPDVHVADTHAWTPFAASEALAPNDIAAIAAKELEPLIAARSAKLDACFAERTGSLRAMLRVAFDGGVIGARTGGLGDRDVEVCVAGALVGLKVSAPPIVPEIACDLDRGAPQPWRVTKSGGYKVLDVTATDVLDGGKPMALDSDEHDAQITFLVIAPSTLPAIRIDKATLLVLSGSATLVGIQIDAGAPLFAGMGLDGRLAHGGEDAFTADAVMLAVDPSGSPVRACVDGKFVADAPVDPKSVDALFAKLAAYCTTAKCSTTIAVGPFGSAQDLATLAEAAFRAGTPRLLIGADASCGAQ